MDFNFIQRWNDLAAYEYHVNPTIFVFIMAVTTPLFWIGWAWILKEIMVLRKGKDKNTAKLIRAIIFYLIIWVMPYAYIIFFGRNLPGSFWIIFGSVLAISALFVYRKIGNALNNKL